MIQQVAQRLYHTLGRPFLNHVVRVAHDLSADERLFAKEVHEPIGVGLDDGSIGLLAYVELGEAAWALRGHLRRE